MDSGDKIVLIGVIALIGMFGFFGYLAYMSSRQAMISSPSTRYVAQYSMDDVKEARRHYVVQ